MYCNKKCDIQMLPAADDLVGVEVAAPNAPAPDHAPQPTSPEHIPPEHLPVSGGAKL